MIVIYKIIIYKYLIKSLKCYNNDHDLIIEKTRYIYKKFYRDFINNQNKVMY